MVELACRSSYFADLNPSEIREQITSDLERKVAAHLVKYAAAHGWAKVQRLEDGHSERVARFRLAFQFGNPPLQPLNHRL